MPDVRMPDGTIIKDVPEGTTQSELRRRLEKMRAQQAQPAQRRTPPPVSQVGDVRFEGMNRPRSEGPPGINLGLVGEETRGSVREFVEEEDFIDQLLLESALATVGTAIGGALGSFGGPPGMLGGAMLGGGAGEALAQEFGVTPRSDTALGLSAAAPGIGPAASAATRGARGLAGRTIASSPVVESASARLAQRGAAKEFGRLGGEILAKQRGMMGRTADDLFTAARNAGATIAPDQLKNTTAALRQMERELGEFTEFTDAQQAAKFIERVRQTLEEGDSISFDTLIGVRNKVGAAMAAFERAGGQKLRSANQVFKALVDDMETIAQGAGRERRGARIAQTAFQRAKLENSVAELEDAVSQFTRLVPGEDTAVVNVGRLREWFRKVTDPNNRQFNKNLTDALGDEIPEIKNRLATLDKATEKATRSPAGPGSLVIRGVGAAGGASAGFAVAGPLGAGVGGIAGARLPEMITATLMSRPGSQILTGLAGAGRPVNLVRSGLISTLATQAGLSSERQAPRVLPGRGGG